MRIEIDTSKDSHHDIRKAVRLLLSLVGEGSVHETQPDRPASRNIFDLPLGGQQGEPQTTTSSQQVGAPASNGFAALFGNDSTPAIEVIQDKPAQTTQSSKPDAQPDIEVY